MNIDRQRIAAVRTLEALGYSYREAAWQPPAATKDSLITEADAMHAVLLRRADALMSCSEGTEEAAELEKIADVLVAYEEKRWPLGKESGKA
jgi:hypothetical protein